MQHLGVLFVEEGRFQEAEQHFRQAVAEAPTYLNAWLGLADLYLKQQRFQDVEDIIQQLGQMPSASLEKAILRAQLCLARRSFDEARTILEQVIGQAPGSVFARLVLSRVFLQEGRDWKAAEQALRDVLALDPNHAEARNNLEILLRRQVG